MQKTTTLKNLKLFFGKMLPVLILLALCVGSINAQPFINGNLSTGATASTGTAAPAGYTWSELQTGGNIIGFGNSLTGGTGAAMITVADDFTIPAGVGWNLSKFTCYAYSTNFVGAVSPFTDIRIQIFNTDPSVGSPTPVFGNLTTNRFTASSDALMYRITSTQVGTARKIWKIEANIVPPTLGPGHYWIEWTLGNGGLSNFSPPSTVAGTLTQAGNNGKNHDFGGPGWTALLDTPPGSNTPQDMPFRLDYTVVAAPACTAITGAILSRTAPINQNFDVAIPLPAGWVQQNLSNTPGQGYIQGNAANFPAHSGAGNSYISALWSSTGANIGTISNWLFAPSGTLNNGDVFSFWTRTSTGQFPDRMQVRLSTNGASTNAGASETSTGDFSTLLLDINPTYTAAGYPTAWQQFTITLSGLPAAGVSGRIAFRYFVENGGIGGTNSDVIGIDDVSLTSSAPQTICTGGSGCIKVDVTGGTSPYTIVYNAAPGGNTTVNNYISGTCIPVSPAANTVYSLVSVTGLDGCVSPANSGTATVNVVTGSTAAVLSQVQVAGPPTNLINEGFTVFPPVAPVGWTVTNNSQPLGIINYFQGNPAVFPANSGATNSYAGVNFNSGANVATISDWLFIPSIASMKNGDKFTFYTRTVSAVAFPDRLQVRLNTTNTGNNVGATATSVGDFTTLLLDINPTYTLTGYPNAWTQYTITMSGLPAGGVAGRLAFRYFVENGGPSAAAVNSDYIGIDDVVYTTFPTVNPTTCTGSTANLKVDITGGTGPYTVVIQPTPPGTPGSQITVTNYVSGANIPVTPPVTTTYSLVSVTSATGCAGTGNSGTPTITVSPTTQSAITIVDDPTGPLCAGNPKLLTVQGGSSVATFPTGPVAVVIPAAGTGAATGSPASVYPITNAVAGLPAGATIKSVTIRGISHTFMSDLDIVLQSPSGQNVILMSDIGVGGDLVNHTLTFDDAGAPLTAATNPPATLTTWHPTNITGGIGNEPDNWPNPGPLTAPTSTTLATFNAGTLNGTWNLFITDDGAIDVGTMTGGFDIVFNIPSAPPVGYTWLWTPAAGLSSTTSNPVAASPMQTTTYTVMGTAPSGCQTTAQITITVNQLPAVVTNPSNTSVCNGGTATFTGSGTGAGATYTWQVSPTGAGGPWTTIIDGAPYSGATTSTLTVSPVTAAMNGYAYRMVVSGSCPPSANSTAAILTVIALPNVTISPAGPVCGGVPGTNGTQLTASGATTYTWAPVAGLYTSNTTTPANAYTGTNLATVFAAPTVNTVYTVTGTNTTTGCVNTASVTVNYTPPAPVVSPNPVSLCIGGPAALLTITSSLAPTTVTANSGPISVVVPDLGDGSPAISNLAIAGIPAAAVISEVKVTFTMTHTFVGDMDINLKAPNGNILNLVGGLDGGAGGNSTDNFTGTAFSSLGGSTISGFAAPRTGTFTAEARPLYGPAGYIQNTTTWTPGLYTTPTSANGTWTLAMGDWGGGDVGTLTSWNISITYGLPSGGIWSYNSAGSGNYFGLFTDAAATTAYTGAVTPSVYVKPTPAGNYNYYVTVSTGTCTTPARLIPVSVYDSVKINTQPVSTAVCTDKTATFSVAAVGSNLTYQWQVSTDNGTTFPNVTNGGVYSGATTNTLVITNPPVSMNGYIYRVVVNGSSPCGSKTSSNVVLTVYPLPTIVISASPYTALFPGLTTTLTSTVSPVAGALFTWLRNGVGVAGATTGTLVVDVDGLGDYQLRVTDVNGCTNVSNIITIRDSVTTDCFLYPNPSGGKFQVRYYSVSGNVLPRMVTVYNSTGTRVLSQAFTVTAPYARMDVDLRPYGKGVYWVEIGDRNGSRISMCRAVVQ